MSALRFAKARVRVDDFIPQTINLVKTVEFLVEPDEGTQGPPVLVKVEFDCKNYCQDRCFDKIYKYVKAAEKRGAEEQCFQLATEPNDEVKSYGDLIAVARDGVKSLWYPTTLWYYLTGEQPLYKEELVRSWEIIQKYESLKSKGKTAKSMNDESEGIAHQLAVFMANGDKEVEAKVEDLTNKWLQGYYD